MRPRDNSHRLRYIEPIMTAQFLTIRLTEAESRLVERLTKQTGLTKSALVKQALQHLSKTQAESSGSGLFELGKAQFGRYGDASRQSAQIAVYRTAKRKAFRNVFDTTA